jgi:hypothetical protein
MLYSSGSSRPPSAPPIRRIPDIFSREYNRVATIMPIRRHENIWTLVRPTTVFDVVTGEMITPNALRKRKTRRGADKVLDSVTGEMITPAALQQRKKSRGADKVLDPVTGDMITPNALRKRKKSRGEDKVLDPVRGDMITPDALRLNRPVAGIRSVIVRQLLGVCDLL